MNEFSAKELIEAFSEIEKHDLVVNTIICSTCGRVVCLSDKETFPCEHLLEMFKDMEK